MRRAALASFLFLSLVFSLVFVACGGSSAVDAKAAGGTPAPDGADGYCCPASTGGCAVVGGYQETGACPTRATLCDNLCDPRIVKDEHGCDTFEYSPCAGGASSSGGARPAADAGNDAATGASTDDASTD